MFNDYCTATISLLLALLAATGTLATFTCPKPVNPIANSPSNACCKELSDLRVKLGGFSLYYGKSCYKATISQVTGPKTAVTEDCPEDMQAGCCDPTLLELTGSAPCTSPNSNLG
ncbi:unnamed protein product [Zymoseptoria tritici ST99CH_3D1]|uniref:Hydrophobin n=2 Tax=Zymoseptoria tritici TaxID=1047171 RepID=A0A1X7RTJ9_ZYMT9|nr:unnamed protein product [Zymoseptoria tritici ST99CH_3D7]SMR52370.1 unnamed protein product [Zymoseptoria tritici ST99CH_1E4]SMR53474.1 unnamed protein product [Zymoseptoria tritici ST99CH_3D1]